VNVKEIQASVPRILCRTFPLVHLLWKYRSLILQRFLSVATLSLETQLLVIE